ncbi:MAG: hypothetical protein E2P02_28555 [Acidobacteria bacterium]|nr:MAG: hypothetical protein E2P02_28555 [Acidobacteriota bacterium]
MSDEDTTIPVIDLAKKVLPYADKKLGEAPFEIVDSSTSQKIPIGIDNVTFTINGGVALHVFNSVDDKDPDGVIGSDTKNEEKSVKSGLDLKPQIPFDGKKAWLKYRVEAGAKGKASFELEKDLKFGFSVEAEKGIAFSDYRRHDRNETVGKAVLGVSSADDGDLLSPRLLLFRKHVEALEPGDALAMTVRGKLGAKVTLSWSDVIASQVNLLGRLIDGGEVFNIKVGASATVSFQVSVEDDYVLIFTRASGTDLRVALKKANKKSLSGSLGITVGAEFEDSKAVEKVLKNFVEGLIKDKIDVVDKLLAASNLNKKQLETLKAVFDRIGENTPLEEIAKRRAELKKHWETFKTTVAKTIKEVATAKASISFAYEYSRVETDTSVLQARFNQSRLPRYHTDLIRGDLTGVLNDATAGNGVTLEAYLNEKSVVRTRSYGLTLGLGKWSFSGKDVRKLIEIKRENAQGLKQISFQGTRSYEQDMAGEKLTWTTDFQASMPKFSATKDPKASEFAYAFSLIAEWDGKTSDGDLRRYVDHAVLWRAVTPGESDSVKAELAQAIGGKQANVVCQLNFPTEVLEPVLAKANFSDAQLFGTALGAAMFPTDLFPAIRQNLALRRNWYGPLWQHYLEADGMTPAQLASAAAARFQHDYILLARHEAEHWKTARTTTIAGLADLNSRTRQQWRSFGAGLVALREAIKGGQSYEKIEACYGDIQELFAQWHHVRALGAYLRYLIERDPHLPKKVESSMTVKYKKAGKDETIVYGVSQGKNN